MGRAEAKSNAIGPVLRRLCVQLDDDGFEMISCGQGYASMSAPTKRLEELVLGKQLGHAGHPVLR
jgi:phage terminase large subunit-like protein